MAFNVGGDAYQRFMGEFSDRLSGPFADLAGIDAGMRVVDVGCGPGALTAELVARLGPGAVSGADPSEPFVAAARSRLPEVDVRRAPAESLPFADGEFDAALAQLVVHFMADPAAGVGEMARVTRPGGVVAVCVWDFAGERGPLSLFWRAAQEVDANARGEAALMGTARGQLEALLEAAGLTDVAGGEVSAVRPYASFEDWWEPYTLGVGPAGDYVRSLDAETLAGVEAACAGRLPEGPFTVEATAWAARGRVPERR